MTDPNELAAEIKRFIADEFGITGGTLHSQVNQLAALAQRQGEPIWSEYVAGMIVAYLGGGVDDPRIKPIAGIISRRLCHIAPATAEQPAEPISPDVMTQLQASLIIGQRDAEATAPAPVTWQPIETAPEDGTWVLLWCTGGTLAVACSFNQKSGKFKNTGGASVCGMTHWIPLPSLPKDQA